MKVIICRHCDMASEIPVVKMGHVAKCTRCHSVIFKNDKLAPPSLLALSIAALIIAIPAFTLPLISLHLLGITEETNLLQGAFMLFNDAPIVAIVVFSCAVIAPTLLTICIAISSACLTYQYRSALIPNILKITQWIRHWSMLEVYMLSLMVAIFKLMHYADLYIGLGFYFFILLLVLNMAMIGNYNNHKYWELYHKL